MRSFPATAALGAALVVLGACGEQAIETPPDATYTVRGIVHQLPNDERRPAEITVRHEAIPDFRDSEGEVVGMESMAMPFTVDRRLTEGFEVGDRVELSFEVRWNDGPPLRVSRLHKLPPDARLELEER